MPTDGRCSLESIGNVDSYGSVTIGSNGCRGFYDFCAQQNKFSDRAFSARGEVNIRRNESHQ